MDWLKVLKVIGPAVLAIVPGVGPFIPLIIAGIELAEESGKPGVEKKQIAKDIVKLGMVAANQVAKKEIVKPEEAVKVADDTIDAIVGVTNIVSNIKTNFPTTP